MNIQTKKASSKTTMDASSMPQKQDSSQETPGPEQPNENDQVISYCKTLENILN